MPCMNFHHNCWPVASILYKNFNIKYMCTFILKDGLEYNSSYTVLRRSNYNIKSNIVNNTGLQEIAPYRTNKNCINKSNASESLSGTVLSQNCEKRDAHSNTDKEF